MSTYTLPLTGAARAEVIAMGGDPELVEEVIASAESWHLAQGQSLASLLTPGRARPQADAAPSATTCPAGFAERSGQGAAGGHPPAAPRPHASAEVIARVLDRMERQLEACWLLAEGDHCRTGIDFLLVDLADVRKRCFGAAP
jgi:hypothetical protein